jgi:hypothetical protein
MQKRHIDGHGRDGLPATATRIELASVDFVLPGASQKRQSLA